MTAIIITAHAAQRYVERIDPTLNLDQAREAIRSHSAVLAKAWAFGCHAVLAGKAKIVLQEGVTGAPTVVTVKHARNWNHAVPPKMHRNFRKARIAKGRGL